MSITLIEQVKQYTTIALHIVKIHTHIKPYVRIHEYTGPTRFIEAMVRVAKMDKDEAVTILGQEKVSWGNGVYSTELSHGVFASLASLSLMREAIPAFVKCVCNFSEGSRNADNSETIITASVDTYGNFAEGHRYWQNLVAQETEVEASKVEAERLAKEIIEAKSTGKSMESFGSGDSIV